MQWKDIWKQWLRLIIVSVVKWQVANDQWFCEMDYCTRSKSFCPVATSDSSSSAAVELKNFFSFCSHWIHFFARETEKKSIWQKLCSVSLFNWRGHYIQLMHWFDAVGRRTKQRRRWNHVADVIHFGRFFIRFNLNLKLKIEKSIWMELTAVHASQTDSIQPKWGKWNERNENYKKNKIELSFFLPSLSYRVTSAVVNICCHLSVGFASCQTCSLVASRLFDIDKSEMSDVVHPFVMITFVHEWTVENWQNTCKLRVPKFLIFPRISFWISLFAETLTISNQFQSIDSLKRRVRRTRNHRQLCDFDWLERNQKKKYETRLMDRSIMMSSCEASLSEKNAWRACSKFVFVCTKHNEKAHGKRLKVRKNNDN